MVNMRFRKVRTRVNSYSAALLSPLLVIAWLWMGLCFVYNKTSKRPEREFPQDLIKALLENSLEFRKNLSQGQQGIIDLYSTPKSELYVSKTFFKEVSSPKKTTFLQREINVLRALHHPNIISVYYAQETSAYVRYWMPFTFGSLASYLKKAYVLYSHQKNYIIKSSLWQLLCALKYLKEKGIVHLDIKLQNVLVHRIENDNIHISLADFGNAFCPDFDNVYDYSVGTIGYAAPEHLKGGKKFSYSSDMWSVGILFSELLFERNIFDGDTVSKILNNIQVLLDPQDKMDLNYNAEKSCRHGDYYNSTFCDSQDFGNNNNYNNNNNNNNNRKKTQSGDSSRGEYNLTKLFEKYKVHKSAKDLLLKLLEINPKDRIDVNSALNHHYFCSSPINPNEFSEDFNEYFTQRSELVKNLPAMSSSSSNHVQAVDKEPESIFSKEAPEYHSSVIEPIDCSQVKHQPYHCNVLCESTHSSNKDNKSHKQSISIDSKKPEAPPPPQNGNYSTNEKTPFLVCNNADEFCPQNLLKTCSNLPSCYSSCLKVDPESDSEDSNEEDPLPLSCQKPREEKIPSKSHNQTQITKTPNPTPQTQTPGTPTPPPNEFNKEIPNEPFPPINPNPWCPEQYGPDFRGPFPIMPSGPPQAFPPREQCLPGFPPPPPPPPNCQKEEYHSGGFPFPNNNNNFRGGPPPPNQNYQFKNIYSQPMNGGPQPMNSGPLPPNYMMGGSPFDTPNFRQAPPNAFGFRSSPNYFRN